VTTTSDIPSLGSRDDIETGVPSKRRTEDWSIASRGFMDRAVGVGEPEILVEHPQSVFEDEKRDVPVLGVM
jgi:hypothetical protein